MKNNAPSDAEIISLYEHETEQGKQSLIEILKIYREASDDGKRLLETLFFCADKYKQDFFSDIQPYYDTCDTDGLIKALGKWKDILQSDAETI